VSRPLAAVVITLLLPLTLAASDPRNDAVACLGTHGRGDPPDLVAAVGRASEEGSSATWRLTFAHPLRVPDPTEPPFRVDVVIRDPKVPAVSFGDYRDFNRIVRFDATGGDARLELLFIAEGGHTLFDPPVIDGDTMTIRMPGRLLLGADEFGPAAMQRLRWTVIVRDGGRCDLLGRGGPPTLRLQASPPGSPSVAITPSQPMGTGGPSTGGDAVGVVIVAILVLVAILVVAYLIRRRR
jgi:hypothetical protein